MTVPETNALRVQVVAAIQWSFTALLFGQGMVALYGLYLGLVQRLPYTRPLAWVPMVAAIVGLVGGALWVRTRPAGPAAGYSSHVKRVDCTLLLFVLLNALSIVTGMVSPSLETALSLPTRVIWDLRAVVDVALTLGVVYAVEYGLDRRILIATAE